jgi:hypothetical protein
MGVKLASFYAGHALMPLGIIVLLGLPACAGVNTRNVDGVAVKMSRDDFAAYVEKTFRNHNRVVNELISISAGGELGVDDPLAKAEEAMAAKCQPLNEMVSATMEKRTLSFWAKMRLPEQVPACAAATRKVEAMMAAP